jgi:hypothetical protein
MGRLYYTTPTGVHILPLRVLNLYERGGPSLAAETTSIFILGVVNRPDLTMRAASAPLDVLVKQYERINGKGPSSAASRNRQSLETPHPIRGQVKKSEYGRRPVLLLHSEGFQSPPPQETRQSGLRCIHGGTLTL